jgi:hypothetical protein
MTTVQRNCFLQSQKAWENKINPDNTRIEADFPDQTTKEIIIGPSTGGCVMRDYRFEGKSTVSAF